MLESCGKLLVYKNWGSNLGQGFSEGMITAKITMLRNIKTALLTEIYKRELKLPE